MSTVKSDLRYTVDHDWVNSDSPARVGISDYAQNQLGENVYAELTEDGDEVTAGEECAELEPTKQVDKLQPPVTGTVAEVNEALLDNPELINDDPYGEGWLYSVTVSADGPLKTAEEYAEVVGGTVE